MRTWKRLRLFLCRCRGQKRRKRGLSPFRRRGSGSRTPTRLLSVPLPLLLPPSLIFSFPPPPIAPFLAEAKREQQEARFSLSLSPLSLFVESALGSETTKKGGGETESESSHDAGTKNQEATSFFDCAIDRWPRVFSLLRPEGTAAVRASLRQPLSLSAPARHAPGRSPLPPQKPSRFPLPFPLLSKRKRKRKAINFFFSMLT